MSNNPFTAYSKADQLFISEFDSLKSGGRLHEKDGFTVELIYEEVKFENSEPENTGELLYKTIDKRDLLSSILEKCSTPVTKFMQGHYNTLLNQNKLQDWQSQLEYYRNSADKVSAELIGKLPLYESTIKSHFEHIKDSIPVVYNTVITIPLNIKMLGNSAVKNYLDMLYAQLYHVFTEGGFPLIEKNTHPDDFVNAFSDKDNTTVKLKWIAKKKSGNGANLMVWFFRDILCGQRRLMIYEDIEPWLFNTFVDLTDNPFKKSNAKKWAKEDRIESNADKNENIVENVNRILGKILSDKNS
ncbi:MAG: hypothetical protein ACK4Y6_08905 [Bacteroidota bacterium]|jgi:hypothetical protein